MPFHHNIPATYRNNNSEIERQQDSDLDDPESTDAGGDVDVNILLEEWTGYGATLHDGTQRSVNVVREPTSTQEISCTFDLVDFFERPDVTYAVLFDQLTILQTEQRVSDFISRHVVSLVHEYISHRGPSNVESLYLQVRVGLGDDEHRDWDRRAMGESMVELERRNDGRVAASETAVKSLLKSVRVEDESDISCPICLEDLKIGSYATSMPCSHLFHGDCITCWLKESHYCPLCRFEMPID